MAGSDTSSSEAKQPLNTLESKINAIDISIKTSRRKLNLVAITILLNVLLWSSLVCLIASIYQIASDPRDATNVAPVVLTSTSVSKASRSYIAWAYEYRL
jgi:hypothetical protein